MQEHELWITALFNHFLPGVGNWALSLVGMHAEDPAKPWANYITLQFVVALALILMFLYLRRRLSVDNPGGFQHFWELTYGFLRGECDDIIGGGGRKYLHFMSTVFIFILAANLLGVVPWFESPTMFPAVPLGCAVGIFVYYHVVGVQKKGIVRYLIDFAGPMPALAPLMVPIEIISHLGRVLSLTVRLFANMFASESVLLVFIGMAPFAIPAIFLGEHIFKALLQAYIFVLLTMVYVQGAVSEEH